METFHSAEGWRAAQRSANLKFLVKNSQRVARIRECWYKRNQQITGEDQPGEILHRLPVPAV